MSCQWLVQSGWLNFLGLVLNFLGAVVLVYGAIISRRRAEQVSGGYFGGNQAATEDRVTMSRNWIIGIFFWLWAFSFSYRPIFPNERSPEHAQPTTPGDAAKRRP